MLTVLALTFFIVVGSGYVGGSTVGPVVYPWMDGVLVLVMFNF